MISREEVLQLAELARLKLQDGEVENLQKDISNILEYVGQVSNVSSDPTTPATPLVRNVVRADMPREGGVLFGKEESVKSAFPKEEKGYNVVRKIIQKDE